MIATRRPHSPPNIHKIPTFSIYKNKKKVSKTQNRLQFTKEIPLKCFYKNSKKADFSRASQPDERTNGRTNERTNERTNGHFQKSFILKQSHSCLVANIVIFPRQSKYENMPLSFPNCFFTSLTIVEKKMPQENRTYTKQSQLLITKTRDRVRF